MSRIELAVEKVKHLDENQADALLEWLELRKNSESLRQRTRTLYLIDRLLSLAASTRSPSGSFGSRFAGVPTTCTSRACVAS